MTEAINPKFKIGQIITAPSGKQIEITRSYNSEGSNMYHYKYLDTGEEGYNALFEYQLLFERLLNIVRTPLVEVNPADFKGLPFIDSDGKAGFLPEATK